MPLSQLRRLRWGVRATLLLSIAASIVANVLHALHNPVSQAIAAWPPLALLLTVELISRVPVHRKVLAAARVIATTIIAGIAAWVSYWHMAGVASRYGETGASPYLLPLSVDGLIVVASICLVELSGRIVSLSPALAQPAVAQAPAAEAAASPAPTAAAQAPIIQAAPTGVPQPASTGLRQAAYAQAGQPTSAGAAQSASAQAGFAQAQAQPARIEAVPDLIPTPAAPRPVRAAVRPLDRALAEAAATLPRAGGDTGFNPVVTRRTRAAASTPGRAPVTESVPMQRVAPDERTGNRGGRRSPAETLTLADDIRARRPGITETEIAAELGISVSRWRTIRREAD